MAFFANAKLVLGSVGALVFGILVAIFRARGKEIEEQEEEIKDLKATEKANKNIKEVSEEVESTYTEEEKEIEEHYDDLEGTIYKAVDKPLTPTLLSKLRNIQGLQNNHSNPPE